MTTGLVGCEAALSAAAFNAFEAFDAFPAPLFLLDFDAPVADVAAFAIAAPRNL